MEMDVFLKTNVDNEENSCFNSTTIVISSKSRCDNGVVLYRNLPNHCLIYIMGVLCDTGCSE